MNEIVIDIEGDSLTPTKLHCISYKEEDYPIRTCLGHTGKHLFTDTEAMWIGHNFIRFDAPVIKRLLNLDLWGLVVDTLALSWYLYPKRNKHGLEDWGEELGHPKVQIDDWVNLPIETYVERCETDVLINKKLWDKMKQDLLTLYNGDWDECMRLIRYLSFKMRCAELQERSKIKLDIELARKTLDVLEVEKEKKTVQLVAVMPKVPTRVMRNPPEKPFKKDGTRSVTGQRWVNLLNERGLPSTHRKPIEVVTGEEEPNPGSHVQVKKWLFDLGWEPQHYVYKRDKETGDVRKIPQIKSEADDGDLCPSIYELVDSVPDILHLAGLGIINHRISIFKGYLKNVDEEGYLYAGIAGMTNTLRFKHKAPLVNLPQVGKPWGEEVRGCLKAREGYELCGSDQSSLENNTGLHFMYEHDPEYVEEQTKEGFDPHLDLALFDGVVTAEDIVKYNNKELDLSDLRRNYKTANYGCKYGVQPESLARQLKSGLAQAKKLHKVYWKRNWSIEKVTEECKVKTIGGQMWLFNPVSKFWYSLRHLKDRFSTLNQGTGVYVFDIWVNFVLKERPQLSAQFHDEILLEIKKGYREQCKKLLRRALDKTNEKLKMNIKFDISIDFGQTYAEVH